MKKTLTFFLAFTLVICSSFNVNDTSRQNLSKENSDFFCGPNFFIDSHTSLRRAILKGPNGQEVVDYPANDHVFSGVYSTGAYRFTIISNIPTMNLTITVVDVTNSIIVGTGSGTGAAYVDFSASGCYLYKFTISGF